MRTQIRRKPASETTQPARPANAAQRVQSPVALASGKPDSAPPGHRFSQIAVDVPSPRGSVAPVQMFPVQVTARGPAHLSRGGTSMTALVGAESEWTYGSRPARGTPNLMKKVGATVQGTKRYVAGHLLNDNMGGLGVNNNLTVLSATANAAHRGIEGRVKTLAQKADQINGGSHTYGNPAYDHGVEYSVSVLAPAPAAKTPFSPSEKNIGAGLTISITPIRFHKGTHARSAWPQEAGSALLNYPLNNVPPYPAVPKKKKLTPMQRHIVEAIAANGAISSPQQILNYIHANLNATATKVGVALALKRGVSARFFYRRAGGYGVTLANI